MNQLDVKFKRQAMTVQARASDIINERKQNLESQIIYAKALEQLQEVQTEIANKSWNRNRQRTVTVTPKSSRR